MLTLPAYDLRPTLGPFVGGVDCLGDTLGVVEWTSARFSNPFEGCPQALLANGFEQVVDGANFEGAQRVFAVGGYEDDGRQRALDAADDFEAVLDGHLDVE